MFGNSICPPLVAVLATVLLQRVGNGRSEAGQSAALHLALGAVAPHRRPQILASLHHSWRC